MEEEEQEDEVGEDEAEEEEWDIEDGEKGSVTELATTRKILRSPVRESSSPIDIQPIGAHISCNGRWIELKSLITHVDEHAVSFRTSENSLERHFCSPTRRFDLLLALPRRQSAGVAYCIPYAQIPSQLENCRDRVVSIGRSHLKPFEISLNDNCAWVEVFRDKVTKLVPGDEYGIARARVLRPGKRDEIVRYVQQRRPAWSSNLEKHKSKHAGAYSPPWPASNSIT